MAPRLSPARSSISNTIRHGNAPIARVQLEDSSKVYMLVTEGVGIGEVVSWGTDVEVKNGNTLPLQSIPTGFLHLQHRVSPQRRLASLSARPGSRQSLSIRSATASVCGCPAARPSGSMQRCRATIGIVAGGGRVEKPFVKAGNKSHKMKNTASNWPRVRGVAMNVIDHPFGGGGHQHPGRPKTIARGTSPGRTVGHVAARQTGRSRK